MLINLVKNIITEYSKIFIFLGVAVMLTLALVFINWILVKKSQAFNKTSVYECGFDNFNSAKEKFTVHFYIIAILFVIFDVEMIFLYAISYSITTTKFLGVFILFFFLIILIFGLIFEWNNGVLNWNKKTFNFGFLSFLFFDLDCSFYDVITFVLIFIYFLSFNLILIFNRTITNLLSLIFFLILGCIFLLVTFKVEFIVYSYLLVYVGGISVLFLFGLMSINQKLEYKKFSLISFNKLFLNIVSSVLSFFLYNSSVRGKLLYETIVCTTVLAEENGESRALRGFKDFEGILKDYYSKPNSEESDLLFQESKKNILDSIISYKNSDNRTISKEHVIEGLNRLENLFNYYNKMPSRPSQLSLVFENIKKDIYNSTFLISNDSISKSTSYDRFTEDIMVALSELQEKFYEGPFSGTTEDIFTKTRSQFAEYFFTNYTLPYRDIEALFETIKRLKELNILLKFRHTYGKELDFLFLKHSLIEDFALRKLEGMDYSSQAMEFEKFTKSIHAFHSLFGPSEDALAYNRNIFDHILLQDLSELITKSCIISTKGFITPNVDGSYSSNALPENVNIDPVEEQQTVILNSKPQNSSGFVHGPNGNWVLDSEVDIIGQYLFFDSNPYMLLFSMFFLLVSLIVSIELCVITKKKD